MSDDEITTHIAVVAVLQSIVHFTGGNGYTPEQIADIYGNLLTNFERSLPEGLRDDS